MMVQFGWLDKGPQDQVPRARIPFGANGYLEIKRTRPVEKPGLCQSWGQLGRMLLMSLGTCVLGLLCLAGIIGGLIYMTVLLNL